MEVSAGLVPLELSSGELAFFERLVHDPLPPSSPSAGTGQVLTWQHSGFASFTLKHPVTVLTRQVHLESPGESHSFRSQPTSKSNSSCKFNPPVPGTLAYSRVWGIGIGTLVGRYVTLPTTYLPDQNVFTLSFWANCLSKAWTSSREVSGANAISGAESYTCITNRNLFGPELFFHSELYPCLECILTFALFTFEEVPH